MSTLLRLDGLTIQAGVLQIAGTTSPVGFFNGDATPIHLFFQVAEVCKYHGVSLNFIIFLKLFSKRPRTCVLFEVWGQVSRQFELNVNNFVSEQQQGLPDLERATPEEGISLLSGGAGPGQGGSELLCAHGMGPLLEAEDIYGGHKPHSCLAQSGTGAGELNSVLSHPTSV